ncbi:pyrimidine/purine nucleoside phosphorylase [Massilia cavernae]|uniref:DUF1255 family protein n=1 Tax=Massilia cavernae TaxID=2320864 RepID=A0A418Y839_9BURK|nr:pyrimidine/purine nucleoside phosphorylase [Massilia cavernae]RJG27455.1 DUF1255 family protein [Massilia cavernae]
MGTHFEHVSMEKKANIFADGKCISYTLTFPDGETKTVGVIMPGGVTFAADTDETFEVVEGKGSVSINGDTKDFAGGQRFHVKAQERFDVEAAGPVHYVTHMGRK